MSCYLSIFCLYGHYDQLVHHKDIDIYTSGIFVFQNYFKTVAMM